MPTINIKNIKIQIYNRSIKFLCQYRTKYIENTIGLHQ